MREFRGPGDLMNTDVLPAVPARPTGNDTVRAELRAAGVRPTECDYLSYLLRVRAALARWKGHGGRHRLAVAR